MTNVRMKALDTLHISGVGPDNLVADAEFEVPTGIADVLEARGLAERIGGAKKAHAPENKMEAAPVNKTISADSLKAPAKRKGAK